MGDDRPTLSPPSAELYNRLRAYANGFMGGEDWPPEHRWRIYQVKHSLVHSLLEAGFPINLFPDYERITMVHLLAGVALGLTMAGKDMDTVLYEVPRPGGDSCEWPWTLDEWQRKAAEVREKEKQE